MLYCPECQVLCGDENICPSCEGTNLRKPYQNDRILLMTADEIKAKIVAAAFHDNQLDFDMEVCESGDLPSFVFGKSANTKFNLYIQYGQTKTAKDILHSIGFCAEANEAKQACEKKLSPGKKLLIRILSAALFILAVWAVVAVSDYVANALKAFLFHS